MLKKVATVIFELLSEKLNKKIFSDITGQS